MLPYSIHSILTYFNRHKYLSYFYDYCLVQLIKNNVLICSPEYEGSLPQLFDSKYLKQCVQ